MEKGLGTPRKGGAEPEKSPKNRREHPLPEETPWGGKGSEGGGRQKRYLGEVRDPRVGADRRDVWGRYGVREWGQTEDAEAGMELRLGKWGCLENTRTLTFQGASEDADSTERPLPCAGLLKTICTWSLRGQHLGPTWLL